MNLVNYLKFQLNLGNVAAVTTVTNLSGTCSVTLLLGAFLADSYLGRYWTIAASSTVYVFVRHFHSQFIIIINIYYVLCITIPT